MICLSTAAHCEVCWAGSRARIRSNSALMASLLTNEELLLPSALIVRPSNRTGRIAAPLGQSAAQESTYRSHGLSFFLVSSSLESAGMLLTVIVKPAFSRLALSWVATS